MLCLWCPASRASSLHTSTYIYMAYLRYTQIGTKSAGIPVHFRSRFQISPKNGNSFNKWKWHQCFHEHSSQQNKGEVAKHAQRRALYITSLCTSCNNCPHMKTSKSHSQQQVKLLCIWSDSLGSLAQIPCR